MTNKIVVKGYQVGAQIDQSGLRTVYKALHLASGNEVFLTVVPVRAGRSLNNLMRRAQLSKRLTIPGLVPAIDYGVIADKYFFFSHMAIASVPITQVLADIIGEEEKLYSLVRLVRDVLEYIDYLHEAGTTHRDLNTSQLRIDHNGGVILEGFVNARPKVEPRNIANVVNLPYMSPEQLISAAPADRKTDIYSLGVILFELVTGVVPYESNHQKIEDARNGVVPSPSMYKMDVPCELEAIVLKALSPRASRYKHVRELYADLEVFHNRRSIRHKIKDLSQTIKNLFVVRN